MYIKVATPKQNLKTVEGYVLYVHTYSEYALPCIWIGKWMVPLSHDAVVTLWKPKLLIFLCGARLRI